MTAPNETMSDAKQPTMDDIRKLRGILKTPPATNASERAICETCGEYTDQCNCSIESETPRTDAVVVLGVEYKPTSSCAEVVDAEFARDLERELAEAREKLSVLDKQVRELDRFGSHWQVRSEAQAEKIEQLQNYISIGKSWDAPDSRARNIVEEIERLRGRLEAIRKLGLGPDKGSTGWQAEQAHQIATEALAAQNPAGDGDAPWNGKMVSADGLRSIAPPFQQPAPSSVSFVWWSWHPHYPYWSRSCWAGHSVEAAMEHLSNPARKLSAYHNKLIREGGGTLIEVMDVPCVEMENWKRCAEEAEQSAADGSGSGDQPNPHGYPLNEQGSIVCECGKITNPAYKATPELVCWSCKKPIRRAGGSGVGK